MEGMKINIKFQSEKLKGGNSNLGDLDIDGRIIVK
jgi:hypothetical protein